MFKPETVWKWTWLSKLLNLILLDLRWRTLSARAYCCWLRGAFPGTRVWLSVHQWIDRLFLWLSGEKDHCFSCYSYWLLVRSRRRRRVKNWLSHLRQ